MKSIDKSLHAPLPAVTTALAAMAAVAAMSVFAVTPASYAQTLQIRPGFQRILEHGSVTRISIGNPEIIEARPLPKSDGVLVVGKKEGETDLVIWEKDQRTSWEVSVQGRNAYIEETRAFISSFPGLVVTESGNSTIVSGTVSTPADKKLLEDFSRSRPNVHLRLSLPEERKTLLSYDLKIIEVSKGSNAQLGIKWPDYVPVNGSLSAEKTGGAAFSVSSDFETRLNLLLADGRARILANPRLVCETGESADFLAGGEIPIVIATPETRKVEWKIYGIILKLQSKLDAGNRIRTRITAEISSVDHGSGSSQVPAFLTRRVTTNFSSLSGGTVMLSGLIKSDMAKDVSKVPVLGQIPILGELFKSRSFRENQSELAIFITPSEAKEDSRGEAAAWDTKAKEAKENMRFRLID
ncbi:MAG: pilus assembly protein N-terminal domain-containing protein [Deltaproteobacteria bacterium]|nr:pilus assembly protein N-terminal domain-containing protein [Deltaproteobacteria bacterium]